MLVGHIQSAASNLRASRWRTNLTMLGIIIGISSVITLVSLGEGFRHQLVGQIDRLGSNTVTIRPGKLITNANGEKSLNFFGLLSASTLTDTDINELSKNPEISALSPINFVAGSIKSDDIEMDNVSVVGTSETLPTIMNLDINYGSFFSAHDGAQKVAVVGAGVASKLYGEFNPVGHTVTIGGQNFIIRGVLAKTSTGIPSAIETDFNSAVIIPYSQSKELSGGNTNILQILISPKPGINSDKILNESSNILKNAHSGTEDFTILEQSQLKKLINDFISQSTNFVTGIAAISLLVGGIGIMDIMLASVSERTREIGIRKAVGATNRQIVTQFFFEGLVLSLSGGLIGVAFGSLCVFLIKIYTSLDPIISVPVLFLAMTVSIVIGVIFSIAPAIKAARKNPIDALRG